MPRLLVTLIITALTGCAAPAKVDPAKRAELARSEMVCVTQRECEIKWSTARKWVLDNSGYKIKTLTDDFLETYNPIGGSSYIGVRLNKVPRQAGGYRIEAHIWCDNMFGCNPDSTDAALDLVRKTNASTK